MGTLELLVPVPCVDRGTPPACTATLPARTLRATVKIVPPEGGTADWDLVGGFGTVQSLHAQCYIYNTAGGEDEPFLTGDQYGDIQIDVGASPYWIITTLFDADLTSNSMPDTETASVGVRLEYIGSDSSGTPIQVHSVDLNLEAHCPC
jgi:hypothetical protein